MKKSIKYPKIDNWCYTATKTNARKRIKRYRNKAIRNKERQNLKYMFEKINSF